MTAADNAKAERRHYPRPGQPDFLQLYQESAQYRIELIREGVPARAVGELSALLAMSKESLLDALGIARATLSRKVRENLPLAPDESERVLGVQALIGQVQAMVAEAEAPQDFDAAAWMSRWLTTPLAALGGATPASYLDTVEGQKYIANLLAMAQGGAYA